MERMLVVTFDSEATARKAAGALERLADNSAIALNNASIVTKSSDGATTVTSAHDAAPSATMGGTAVGGLIGLVGYNGIGLLIGGAAGFVIGVIADWARNRVSRDFVADVADLLEPAKTALVAQIDEEDTERINEHMRALGGVPFRRPLSDVTDDEFEYETQKRAYSHARR
jgi:uncharacterized membrane protein